MPEDTTTLNFLEFLAITQTPLASGKNRVFYTRRNDEMIQGLIAKYVFGSHLTIVFSSSAQRHHTTFSKWLMRSVDSIVATSHKAASYLKNTPNIIIPHGIDTERFHPPQNKQKAWEKLGYPGKMGIGIFGRVRHSKGVDVLIQAALKVLPKYPDATILVCGETQNKDRAYHNALAQAAQNAGLEKQILFIGKQDFTKLPAIFQGVSVVAALSRNEGYGLTPLEGMASGAAALTSHAGVWSEVILPQHGELVATDNVDETEKALDRLLSQPLKTQIMGQEAAKHILAHYNIQNEAKRIITYIRSLP